jgi:hypothetical protein
VAEDPGECVRMLTSIRGVNVEPTLPAAPPSASAHSRYSAAGIGLIIRGAAAPTLGLMEPLPCRKRLPPSVWPKVLVTV